MKLLKRCAKAKVDLINKQEKVRIPTDNDTLIIKKGC